MPQAGSTRDKQISYIKVYKTMEAQMLLTLGS
jgi:hypothetical protein